MRRDFNLSCVYVQCILTNSLYAMLLGWNSPDRGCKTFVWYKVYASTERSLQWLFSFGGVQSDCINAINGL